MLSRRIVPLPSRLTRGALLRAFLQQVHALDDLLLGAGLQARHRVVLVQQRQVVVDVVLLLDHALQAVVQDHADLVREGRVVADAVRDRAGQDVAVAVLVLQAFAVQRGAARGAAEQEAARLHVAGGPGQVADALEAEHRVVDVERHHDRGCSSSTTSPPRSSCSCRPASLMPSCRIWPALSSR